MKLNITPGPWELTTVPIELLNHDEKAAIYGKIDKHGGSPFIAGFSRSPGDDKDDPLAVVTAVNNTYHAGIDPEAVPGMLELLKDSLSEISWLLRKEKEREGNGSYRADSVITKLNNIIQKATL